MLSSCPHWGGDLKLACFQVKQSLARLSWAGAQQTLLLLAARAYIFDSVQLITKLIWHTHWWPQQCQESNHNEFRSDRLINIVLSYLRRTSWFGLVWRWLISLKLTCNRFLLSSGSSEADSNRLMEFRMVTRIVQVGHREAILCDGYTNCASAPAYSMMCGHDPMARIFPVLCGTRLVPTSGLSVSHSFLQHPWLCWLSTQLWYSAERVLANLTPCSSVAALAASDSCWEMAWLADWEGCRNDKLLLWLCNNWWCWWCYR